MSEFRFEMASAEQVKGERERVQTVDVITDMTRRCSRCKERVVAEPLSLSLVDVVGSKERHDAQMAVARAMYEAAFSLQRAMHVAAFSGPDSTDPQFVDLPWERQSAWLRAAAADSWHAESFSIDAVGIGLPSAVRAAGVEEAKKWVAYTDRSKVFRVSMAKFPPGWVHISFEAHSSRTGDPVQHANVMVAVCPKCAPAIFDAANINPLEPLGDGVKW